MTNEKEIVISKNRHVWVYILIGVLVVAIAATFIGLASFGFFSHQEGFIALTLTADEDVPGYSDGMSMALYLDGSGYQVNQKLKQANADFTDSMKRAYMICDANDVHELHSSVSRINEKLGQDVMVSEDVYEIVYDAYQKTLLDQNYSVFAGPLYDEWDRLFSLAQNGHYEQDPINNDDEAQYLSDLSTYINDASNFTITFKENYTINLSISSSYKSFISNNEIDSPIISLNKLRTSYEVKIVKEMMEELGYSNGYIVSSDGTGVTLKGTEGLNHSLLMMNEGSLSEIGYVEIEGEHSFAKRHSYQTSSNGFDSFYTVKKDDVIYYQSPKIDLANGASNDYYMIDYLISPEKDIVSLVLESEYLNSFYDDSFTPSVGVNALLNKKSDSKKIYASSDIVDSIKLYGDEYQVLSI